MSIAEEFQAALDATGQTFDRQMQQPGVTLATVTNITDPDQLNRVKCLPIENEETEETDWCYVMAPLGGMSCGQFFFPNVNDLVVLGYLGGDPHRPIVLGAIWNTAVTPPYTIEDGNVYHFSIKTPNGTELLFYDEPEKQKATLTLPSGSILCIDDENKQITLQDQEGENALQMNLEGGEVTLKAKTKLTLSAGDTTIVLNQDGNMTQNASTKIAIETATLQEKGSSQYKVEGGTVDVQASSTMNLQASGTATLKGAMVNINS